jgi:hypothetical protein
MKKMSVSKVNLSGNVHIATDRLDYSDAVKQAHKTMEAKSK